LGYVLSLAIGLCHLKYNHWTTNNIFGIAFSLQAIQFMSLGSFKNGFILLAGLFFYDIFWVFGTEVMVKVAKSFDAPIKLLFPQPSGDPPSLLGLGDIVIPGLFVALMLRFDYVLQKRKNHENQTKTKPNKTNTFASPIKIYFWWQMFGYFVGLTTTVLSMYYFKAAQPALLYLVPTALISSVALALYRNEFWPLVTFDEEKEKQQIEPVTEEPNEPNRNNDIATKGPKQKKNSSKKANEVTSPSANKGKSDKSQSKKKK